MNNNRIQAACIVALLSSCSVVSDFDFAEGDSGTSDAAPLDANLADTNTPVDSSADSNTPDTNTPDGGPDASVPLVLTDLVLTDDGIEAVLFLDEEAVEFDPAQVEYEAEVRFFVREVTITATTDIAGATLTVNGAAVTSGTSTPVELGLGDNVLIVVVTQGERNATYTLEVDRDDELQNTQYIKSDLVALLAGFGRTVAMAGDLLVIGAPGERVAGQLQAGAAYIFKRDGMTWGFVQRVEGAGETSGLFGTSVATDGDLIAVGASQETSEGVAGAGAVYIYREPVESTWFMSQRISQDTPMALDRFGTAVALEGRRLAIGARGADAVYSYALAASWTPVETLRPPAGLPVGPLFGSALVMSGDTLVVAANSEDAGGEGGVNPVVAGISPASGAVFVYRRDGMNWIDPAYLKAFDPQASDRFGSAIAFDGDLLAVGAVEEDSGTGGVGTEDDPGVGRSNSGAVYTFRRDAAGTWTGENYIKAESPVINAEFGSSLAMRGNLLFVGEPDGSAGVANSGSASLYVHSSSGWSYADLSPISPRPTDLDSDDSYGVSLGVSAHGLVAGASREDGDGSGPGNNDLTSAGGAYSFAPTP